MQLLSQQRKGKLLASHKSFYILLSMYIFPFVLCSFSKLPDSPNQHKSIFFPFSSSSFFPGGRLCLYFHRTPPGTDCKGRQVFVPHLCPKRQTLLLMQGHLFRGAAVVLPLPFSVGKGTAAPAPQLLQGKMGGKAPLVSGLALRSWLC